MPVWSSRRGAGKGVPSTAHLSAVSKIGRVDDKGQTPWSRFLAQPCDVPSGKVGRPSDAEGTETEIERPQASVGVSAARREARERQ